MAGPILWGGNSTANNLQNYLTANACIGSSSGQRNYLQTWYFFNQNPTTNIVTTLTATGNRTSGTAFWGSSTTGLLSYITSSPLRYGAMAQMALTGASGAQFVETPMFTLDVADIGKTINISLDYSTSGTFAAGDCTIQIINYSSTGTYQATITPSITNLPSTLSFFQTSFTGTSTATDQYSIRFLSNNASLRTFDIDSLQVSPFSLAVGTPVTPWLSYTPTTNGFGTITSAAFFYRRVGDTIDMKGTFIAGTTTAAAGNISFPPSLTLDTTKITNTGVNVLTPGVFGSSAGITNIGIVLTTAYTGGIQFCAIATNNTGQLAGTNLASSGNFITVAYTGVPIAQWSTQTTLATSGVEFASNSSSTDAADTTSFVNGPGGSAGVIGTTALTTSRAKRIQFLTPIQPTDRINIEIFTSNGSAAIGTGQWLDIEQAPIIQAAGGAYAALPTNQNSTTPASTQGISMVAVAGVPTQLDVIFGRYAYNLDAAYPWNNAGIVVGTKWRVRKTSGIGVGELAPATISSAGYVNGQSGWVAYTPTLVGVGTTSSQTAYYRRIGDSMDIRVKFTVGTPTAVTFQIPLPTGFTIDSTKTPRNMFGTMINNNAASALYIMGTGGNAYLTSSGGAGASETDYLGTNVAAAGWVETAQIQGLPIVGWS